uniref:Probable G-protein coupled receptor (inferred by orthology to a C. elegans protein) n=1 Tax=Strongyloides venezuelensis TaxID=75913 RepID=A0A0K0FCZ2_STRVS
MSSEKHWIFVGKLINLLNSIVPIFGIILNGYVLLRLYKIFKFSSQKFHTSSALPLTLMTICDFICLFSQLSQVFFHFYLQQDFGAEFHETFELFLTYFCKIDIYLIHVTSASSVWCWLVLAVMRFMAVLRPIKYRLIWREPLLALIIISTSCLIFECWILKTVKYVQSFKACLDDEEIAPGVNDFFLVADIIVMFIMPSAIRLILDGYVFFKVYLDSPSKAWGDREQLALSSVYSLEMRIRKASCVGWAEKKKSDNSVKETFIIRSDNYNKKRNYIFLRSIIISAINLICNTPSMVLRLLYIVYPETALLMSSSQVIEGFVQLLYFSQFVCNGFYLSTTIFETTGQ